MVLNLLEGVKGYFLNLTEKTGFFEEHTCPLERSIYFQESFLR